MENPNEGQIELVSGASGRDKRLVINKPKRFPDTAEIDAAIKTE